MSAAVQTLRSQSGARRLMALAVFATGLLLAVQISFFDLDLVGSVALVAVIAALLLAAHRPAIGALVSLGLYADALYFGTYGFGLPTGQLVPLDVVFLGWWALTLLAAFWGADRIVIPSATTWFVAGFYPALLLFYFLYTSFGFGAGMQEMLRSARPFLYLTLFVPLSFWLRAPGAVDGLIRAAPATAVGAAAIQLGVYAMGIDVRPYGLFYEWQVWRRAFEGFDRSNQPFFGLSLIVAGGLVALAITERSRLRKQVWSLCATLLFVSCLISFGRGFWAAMVVSVLTAVLVTARSGRGGSPWAAVPVGALACAALVMTAGAAGIDVPGFAAAAFDRAGEGAQSIRFLDGTLGDRYDNINLALIADHPFLGIGFFLALGTADDIDHADTGHNLYLDMMLRMGVLGLAVFSTLLWLFCRRCRLALSLDPPPHRRAAVVGCLGAAFGNVAWSVSSSHMMNHRGFFEMALMLAVVEVIIAGAGGRGADRRRAS